MRTEYFDFDGLRIAYTAAGEPGRNPLVFLHNAGATRDLWQAQVDQLSTDRQVFALDLFGYGDSDVPDSGYTVARYRDLLSDFLTEHDLADPVLIGNCLGSAVILRLLYDDDRPAGAVLLNPLTAQTAVRGRYGLLVRPAGRLPRAVREWVRRRGMPRWLARRIVGEWFTDRALPDRVPAATRMVDALVRPGRLAALGDMISDLDALALPDGRPLPSAAPPVCTVWGLDNAILSADAGRVLNETLRPAREMWLPGCGHAAMMERPEKVSAIIEAFVGTASARRAAQAAGR